MATTRRLLAVCGLATLFLWQTATVYGQDIYVYPAKKQSDEQLAEDRFACHRWAVDESGFDPSNVDGVTAPKTVRVPVPKNEAKGAANKGAVTGAVVGGVIGSHDGDTAEGAVIGAVLGSMAGAAIEDVGHRKAVAEAEAEAKRQADEIAKTKAELALQKSRYRRAFAACLEGRDYTVR